MPYKSGFSSLFDELLDQAGKVYLSMEEIKQRKAQLKQQQERLNISAVEATNEINRTRLAKFRTNWDIATQMYQQKHPPAEDVARTGLITQQTLTSAAQEKALNALTGYRGASKKKLEEGGGETQLSLNTIESQITQTVNNFTPESADVAGQLLKARTVEELNTLYNNLKPRVPELRMGMKSSDRLQFDRLYDLLARRFQYTTKAWGETVAPSVTDAEPEISDEDKSLIRSILGFEQ